MGKSAADLLTLSGYVRGRLYGAATIVTQLVTHLRLAEGEHLLAGALPASSSSAYRECS